MKQKKATRNLAATFKTDFVDEFDNACKDCSYSKTDALRAFANWWIDSNTEEKEAFCETNIVPKHHLRKLIEPLARKLVTESLEANSQELLDFIATRVRIEIAEQWPPVIDLDKVSWENLNAASPKSDYDAKGKSSPKNMISRIKQPDENND